MAIHPGHAAFRISQALQILVNDHLYPDMAVRDNRLQLNLYLPIALNAPDVQKFAILPARIFANRPVVCSLTFSTTRYRYSKSLSREMADKS